MAPFLVLALALSAYAQGVEKSKDRTETLRIQVSGGVDLDWVWRSREIVQALGGPPLSVTTIEYDANVQLDVELTEKVSVLLNLATTRLDGGIPVGFLGADSQEVRLWDAAVKFSEFFNPDITVQVGTQNDFVFDVRGRGGALFFDPHHSPSFQDNMFPGIAGIDTVGNSDWQQVAGASVWYHRESIHLGIGLLPAISEGGNPSADESAYVAMLYYDLSAQVSKGSRIGVIVAVNHFPGDVAGKEGHSGVITIGAGASLKDIGTQGLELFGEFYFQTGDAGMDPAGTGETLDAGGFAVNVGAHFDFQADNIPWVEGSFTLLSGDDDFADGDVDNFLSYENVNDLLIIENPYFGFNWNTNMTAVKISGGLSLTAGGGALKNNVNLKAILGFVTTTEDVGVAPNQTDTLGTELDVYATWWYSKQVALELQAGFLFGSDVLELVTIDAEDSTFMFTLGASAKF
ncbi:MAG: hypothetical protein HY716_02660 [Planctomycetes bacterium]|nr:hypothetical protein [Planctomycetota bacterium]